jgi:hypothetical protein
MQLVSILALFLVLLRVSENKVLRGDVTGGWRKLHGEELNDLYPSPNTMRVIKSRWMRWAGHAARMREMRNAYRILVKKLKVRYYFRNLGIGGKIILKCMLKKQSVTMWTGFIWVRRGSNGLFL